VGLNLSVLLTDSARRHPDRPALRIRGAVVTYRSLDEASDRAAAGLRAAGVAPGRTVALMLPNGLDFVVAYFGALKAGGTVVPLNVLLRAGELEHCLGDSGAHMLIVGEHEACEVLPIAARLAVRHVYIAGSSGTFAELLDATLPLAAPVDTDPGSDAVLLYTSGTTGRAKGARLTHSGLAWVAESIAVRMLRLTPDDVVYLALPLSHIFGLNALLNVALLAGASIVLEERFDPDRALTLAEEHAVTVFAGVPAMSIGLLAAHRRRPVALPALRVALLGGQSVPGEVRTAFTETFGCRTIESYGVSEVSSAVAATPIDTSAKQGSVGKPIWGAEFAIVDEDDRRCPAGQAGEILVRSVGMMAGYHNLPGATAEAVRDGWFHTGDIGLLDADGDLFVVDRKKDMIIRSGYNVYPREVEEVLYRHTAVLEAAVIGVPHELHGEEIAAAIRLRPGTTATAAELREFTRERLAAYKYPRIVAFLDELPASSTGKLLKRAIDIDELQRTAAKQEAEQVGKNGAAVAEEGR